eukprot:scaffold29195_cov69-Cyclotella_meneghiniana.AAC.3
MSESDMKSMQGVKVSDLIGDDIKKPQWKPSPFRRDISEAFQNSIQKPSELRHMASLEINLDDLEDEDECEWGKMDEDVKSEEVQLPPPVHKPRSEGVQLPPPVHKPRSEENSGLLAILAMAISYLVLRLFALSFVRFCSLSRNVLFSLGLGLAIIVSVYLIVFHTMVFVVVATFLIIAVKEFIAYKYDAEALKRKNLKDKGVSPIISCLD